MSECKGPASSIITVLTWVIRNCASAVKGGNKGGNAMRAVTMYLHVLILKNTNLLKRSYHIVKFHRKFSHGLLDWINQLTPFRHVRTISLVMTILKHHTSCALLANYGWILSPCVTWFCCVFLYDKAITLARMERRFLWIFVLKVCALSRLSFFIHLQFVTAL